MKVSAEPIENSQMVLNIEMDASEVDRYLEQAYSRLVRKVSVPGFRKGKVPRDILQRHIGKDALFQEALQELIPEAYQKAMETQQIDAIAQPRFELIQTEPVVFKAVVPLKPTVKLGDYAGIKVECKPVEVGDRDIEAAIQQLRQQHAMLIPVDRPVQFGDIITIDVVGEKQGEPFPIHKDFVYEVIRESKLPLPGFAEKLEGMIKGEERSFVLSYPADYEIKELAGKEHAFKVTVREIKERKLPDVDDGFARALGSQDLASLRQKMADDLKTGAERRARLELEQKVIQAAVDLSEVEYPPVLIDREISRLLNEEASHFADGVTGLGNYLKSLNKTIGDHVEELRPLAHQRLVQSLVLGKIAEAEKIEVVESELEEEVVRVKEQVGEAELFSLPEARESIKQRLILRKAVHRLVEIATGSG